MRRQFPHVNRLKPMGEQKREGRYAFAGALPFLGTGILLFVLFNFVVPPWWAVVLLFVGVFSFLCLISLKLFKRRDSSR